MTPPSDTSFVLPPPNLQTAENATPRSNWPEAGAALLFVIGLTALAAMALPQHGAPELLLPTQHPQSLIHAALLTACRMGIAVPVSVLLTLAASLLTVRFSVLQRPVLAILNVILAAPYLVFTAFGTAFFAKIAAGPSFTECGMLTAITGILTTRMTWAVLRARAVIPQELGFAARGFGLTGWQRFWQLEIPATIPAMVWHLMTSMTEAWFALLYAEIIALPSGARGSGDIGSYAISAIRTENFGDLLLAIVTVALIVAASDQIVFRPLLDWSNRYRLDSQPATKGVPEAETWVSGILRRTPVLNSSVRGIQSVARGLIWLRIGKAPRAQTRGVPDRTVRQLLAAALALTGATCFTAALAMAHGRITLDDAMHTVALAALTLVRVVLLVVLASVIWLPVAIIVSRNQIAARRMRRVARFFAMFPVILFFPLVIGIVAAGHLHTGLWLGLLLILGPQWPLLLHIQRGLAHFPREFLDAARAYGVSGLRLWGRVLLPGLAPAWLGGAMAASAGAWNITIAAEMVPWGDRNYVMPGIGSYIAAAIAAGDLPRVALGATVMTALSLGCASFLWTPLSRSVHRWVDSAPPASGSGQ